MRFDDPGTETAFVGPRGAGARAQLLLALLLAAVAPIFILGRPIQTHAVKLDLAPLPQAWASAPATAGLHRLSIFSIPEELMRAPPLRRIELTTGDRILADGVDVSLTELRMRLDLNSIHESGGPVELRPDPDARYELFAEVLAVAKWARFERLRLDNARYARSLDESDQGSRPERRRGAGSAEGEGVSRRR